MSRGSRAYSRLCELYQFILLRVQRLNAMSFCWPGLSSESVTAAPSQQARARTEHVIESLEPRLLLSGDQLAGTFARLADEVSEGNQPASIEINVTEEDFALAEGKVRLLFNTSETDGAFDPGAMQLRDSQGTLVSPIFSALDVAGTTNSRLLAEVEPGQYTVELSGQDASVGTFDVHVSLAGDVDGDRDVDMDDLSAARQMMDDGIVSDETDVNADGLVSSFDYMQVRRNLGAATDVEVLEFSEPMADLVSVVTAPDGSPQYRAKNLPFSGTTPSGVLVQAYIGESLVSDDIANIDGDYSLTIALSLGLNEVVFLATDDFGQWQSHTMSMVYEPVSDGPLFAFPLVEGPNEIFTPTATDLNNDGITDYVFFKDHWSAGYNAFSVIGKGDGTFSEPHAISNVDGLFSPSRPLVSDFTGDGIVDLVAQCRLGSDLLFLPGFGDGTFGEYTLNEDMKVRSMVATDFDHDGVDEIVIATLNDSFLLALEYTNGGILLPTDPIVNIESPKHIWVYDYNQDGLEDFIVRRWGSTTGTFDIAIILAQEDGTYQSFWNMTVGEDIGDFVFGDFNNDGYVDVSASQSDEYWRDNDVLIWWGQADGSLAEPEVFLERDEGSWIYVADANGDGITDLFVDTGNLNIYLGGADPLLLLSSESHSPYKNSLFKVSDYNNDAVMDLGYVWGDRFFTALGQGDGTYQTPVFYDELRGVVNVGDFNNDGMLDLTNGVVADGTGQVMLGGGNGLFDVSGPSDLLDSGFDHSRVVKGDFNEDGYADLFRETREVFLGLGDGTFQESLSVGIYSGDDYIIINSSDFNDDDHLDILLLNTGEDSLVLLPGKGNGRFGVAMDLLSSVQSEKKVEAADMNNDGRMDIIVKNAYDRINIHYNNINGFDDLLYDSVVIGSVSDWSIEDLDADGFEDVLFHSVRDGERAILWRRGLGNGVFEDEVILTRTDETKFVDYGDFNGDGLKDVLTGRSVYLYDGAGRLVFDHSYHFDNGALSLGDFNRDGLTDIAQGGVQGTTVWLAGVTPPTASVLSGRVFADTNSDGGYTADEYGIGEVLVEVIVDANSDGLIDAGESVVTSQWTNRNGFFRFEGLAAGHFIVRLADGLPADSHHDTFAVELNNQQVEADIYFDVVLHPQPIVMDQAFAVTGDEQPGDVLGVVEAYHPAGENLTFAINSDRFEIDATGGQLSLAEGQSFDFDTTFKYEETVTISDQSGNTAQLLVSIVERNSFGEVNFVTNGFDSLTVVDMNGDGTLDLVDGENGFVA